MNSRMLKRFLDVASSVLVFSTCADLFLWFCMGYLVPSWTISIMALSCSVLIQVIKRVTM